MSCLVDIMCCLVFCRVLSRLLSCLVSSFVVSCLLSFSCPVLCYFRVLSRLHRACLATSFTAMSGGASARNVGSHTTVVLYVPLVFTTVASLATFNHMLLLFSRQPSLSLAGRAPTSLFVAWKNTVIVAPCSSPLRSAVRPIPVVVLLFPLRRNRPRARAHAHVNACACRRGSCCLCSLRSLCFLAPPFLGESRPESVMGMHFFSPAHMMPLVECIRGQDSSPVTMAVVMEITKRLKKVPRISILAHWFTVVDTRV